MVKVISAYNFQEQNTYSSTGDIAATCLIGSSRLAIAHRNQLIEILTLKNRNNGSGYLSSSSQQHRYTDRNENCQPSKIAFPTIDQVEQLHYCANGNYLVTVEEKSSEQHDSIKQRFVRVYTNFDIANSENCYSIPIRARIASKTTPKISCDDHIEVIEIPLYGDIDDSPNVIACCQMSGTIAISCYYKIYFYEFRRRTNDTNKFHFIDFFEFPFYVQLEFRPLKFEIAEHVVVCLDLETVVAFKIVDLSDINTEDGTTSNGMTTDSSLNHIDHNQHISHYYNNGRNEHIDFEVAKQFNQVNGVKFQSDLRSTWDHDNDRRSIFSEDRPILVNDIKVFLKNTEGIPHNDHVFYSIRSLVQLRIHQQQTGSNKSTAIHDEFRCLALKPIYYRVSSASRTPDQRNIDNHRSTNNIIIDKSPFAHLMKSNYHESCVGFSLFISTVSDGYMYQFTNQGKWYTENTKCLAMYPFTAPVIDIVIDNFVIHAVTECGIETFSSRIGHKLFSSYYEYPMMSDPYPNETSPLVDVPICVMGICGFFGIKFVTSSNHNLILLTTDNEKNLFGNHSRRSELRGGGIRNSMDALDWTIYDLQLPTAEVLVGDIENLACIYTTTSPEIYYELMEEAHIIIRLARELIMIPEDCRDRLEPIANDDVDDVSLEKSYIKTCKMLADFTIQSDRKEIYSQAIAYYSMCKHSIPEIYKQYRDSNLEFDPVGLIYTLKLILSRVGWNKSKAEYLTQNVSNGLNSSNGVDQNYAEEFFDIFVKYSPNDLAQIALSSSVFREVLNEQFYRLYSDARNLTGEEKFCLILCLCHRNETDQALKTYETLQRSDIYTVLREYWSSILFDNFQSDNYRKSSFSDLTESVLFVTEIPELIDAVSDAFIRILIFTHNIDLDFILKLFMNYFAINIGHKGYRTSQRILEILLQAYFYDIYNLNNRNMMMTAATIKCCLNNDNNLSSTQTSSDLLQTRLNLSIGASGGSGNGIAIGGRTCNGCDVGNGNSSSKSLLMDQNQNNSLQLSEESSTNTTVDSNYEDPEFEAMKILFRMYMGLLKQYSSSASSTDSPNSPALPDINGYRLAFIDYMYRNVSLIKSTHCKFDTNILTNSTPAPLLPQYDGPTEDWKTPFRRPIVFFERREMFLNKMEPLNCTGCFKPDVDGVLFFDDWDDGISLVLIKIQALLNSGKLDSSLIIDFITFIHSNPNVIGIDSLLAILLPKSEGVELLIHANPRYLLDYANCRLMTPNQWQVLFKRILVKKRELNAETQQNGIELYDGVIHDILRSLVLSKSRDDLLASIPEQEINRSDYPLDKDNSYWKLGKYRTRTQDGIDETNPFELIMREAVAKQRSDALCAMIQSSGRQLNDAVNNYQLNFN